jgi:hypothetical protein
MPLSAETSYTGRQDHFTKIRSRQAPMPSMLIFLRLTCLQLLFKATLIKFTLGTLSASLAA